MKYIKSINLSHVIVGGGYDDGEGLKSVEILDVATMTWQPGPDFPIPLLGATLVPSTDNNIAYLMGGLKKLVERNVYFNSIYTLKPDFSRWEFAGNMQKKRKNFVALSLNPDFLTGCAWTGWN